MITELLAADPAALHHSVGAAVDFLAQTRGGGDGTSNGAISSIVGKIIQIIGTIAGLGCLIQVAKVGFGKKQARESGMEAGSWLLLGAAVMAVMNLLPRVFGLTETIFAGIL